MSIAERISAAKLSSMSWQVLYILVILHSVFRCLYSASESLNPVSEEEKIVTSRLILCLQLREYLQQSFPMSWQVLYILVIFHSVLGCLYSVSESLNLMPREGKTETDSKLCNSLNSPYPMHFWERDNRHRSNVPCAPWKYFFIFHITFKIWSLSVPANFSLLLYSSFFDFWHPLQPRGFEVGMFVLLGALGIMSENTLAGIGELGKDRYVRKYTCKPREAGQTYTN